MRLCWLWSWEIKLPSTTANDMYFNTFGLNNVCAKYPSLRKAIMAAIDYDELLLIITDNQQELGGYPILNPTYATDVFVNADYYGATNLEVAQKYLDAAKEEGYNMTDPVVVVGSEEYMAAWEELAQMWVDDCAVPYMADTYWFWYIDEDLVTGDEESRQRYWFNAYWVNPEEHQD